MKHYKLGYIFSFFVMSGFYIQTSESFTVKGYDGAEAQAILEKNATRIMMLTNAKNKFNALYNLYKSDSTQYNKILEFVKDLQSKDQLDDILLGFDDYQGSIHFIYDFNLLEEIISRIKDIKKLWLVKNDRGWNILHLLVNLYRQLPKLSLEKIHVEQFIESLYEEYPVQFETLLFTKNEDDLTPLEMAKQEPLLLEILKTIDCSKMPIDVLASLLHALFARQYANGISDVDFEEIMAKIDKECSTQTLTDALSMYISEQYQNKFVITYLNNISLFTTYLLSPKYHALIAKLGGVAEVEKILNNKIKKNIGIKQIRFAELRDKFLEQFKK